ncbi:MAG: NUDIX hydrolase [Verrucomicrobiota bacterium]|nr:NUDIX hydrolase [Verrucomicrobiota bacterium]
MKFQNVVLAAPGWETLSTQTEYENDHLAVASVQVRSPAKPAGQRWTVVHRKAAVVIAAITSDDKLLLIREERVAVQAALWSVPAGQIDDDHAPGPAKIEAVARRELREETGYELAPGGELVSLGDFFTSPGFTDERCHFCLARPVQPGADGAAPTESESILDCRAFPAEELAAMIARNEIRDANTLSLCAKLSALGYLSLGK